MSMRLPLITAVALSVAAGATCAAEVDYALRAGITHSDNVERLPQGQERGARAATVGLELMGQRDKGRLRYDALADLSYNEYLNIDVDSELMGRADLRGEYQIAPERFTWNAGLSYDQVREDILRPQSVGNRESEVRFSTGPTLRARFGGSLEGQLDARFTRLDYGERPSDNETLGARATLGWRSSPRALFAVGYSFDDVSYVSTAPSSLDYQRQEMFAQMQVEGVRTTIDVEAGYADVSGELVDDGSAVVRAEIRRRITPALTGFAGYVREYPTSEETIPFSDAPPGSGSVDASVLTSSPRLTARIETGVRLDRNRSGGELAYSHRRESALVAGSGTRRYHELRASVSREFTPRSRGRLYGAATREDISAAARNTKESIVGTGLTFAFGRALGVELRAEYRDRSGATAADSYNEFGGGLFLRYAPTRASR